MTRIEMALKIEQPPLHDLEGTKERILEYRCPGNFFNDPSLPGFHLNNSKTCLAKERVGFANWDNEESRMACIECWNMMISSDEINADE
jgi:hypothetical protein